MTATTESADIPRKTDRTLSLYHLLDPEVLANPYPLYHKLRSDDPVHWDSFLHAWVVTRYADVVHVLYHFSANRTPTPEQLSTMGLSALSPVRQGMGGSVLFMEPCAPPPPAYPRFSRVHATQSGTAAFSYSRDHGRSTRHRRLQGTHGRNCGFRQSGAGHRYRRNAWGSRR